MKQKIRYFTVLCLTVSLIFVQTISAYACSFIPKPNYWYRLDFDIQSAALPTNVTVAALYPDEHGYVNDYWPTLGHLEFTNNSARAIQLGSLSADAIASNEIGAYDTTEDIEALKPNPQSPGGAKSPPSPFLYEFVVIQDSQHFTVPITVTYRLNPNYDENFIIYGAPLSDYLIQTDAVVLGEVIGAAEDSEPNGNYPDQDGNAQIVGYARIQVEEWLLGEGPDEIEVGRFSFSPGSDCGMGMWMGRRAYFLVRAPEDTTSIRYSLTENFEGSKTVLTANSENAAAIEAALEEQIAPTALPTTDEPTRSLFLPYISR